MILDINNPKCRNEMMLWAKTKGLVLTKTNNLPTYSNAFIIRNEEELESIYNCLPEKFCMRADYRLGNEPVKVSGQNGTKNNVKEYLKKVKKDNPMGAIIVYYNEKFCESYNVDGAIYVDFNVKDAVYIECVGKGFDGREISHGTACHETYNIPWDEVPFFQESKMGQYRSKIVQPEEYLEQRDRRIKSLSNLEKIDKELLEDKIPKEYKTITQGLMQEIKDKILFPLYYAKDLQYNNKEYIALCNIEYENLICAEIYRSERHIIKQKEDKVK